MSQDNTFSEPASQVQIRSALLIDTRTAVNYAIPVRRFLVGLADQACPTIVVSPPTVKLDLEIYPDAEHINYPILRFALLWQQNRRLLVEKLARFKPTVLHCFGPKMVRLAEGIAPCLDVPYVATFNDSLVRFARPAVSERYCASLVASSQSITENLRGLYPRISERIRNINNGTFVEDECSCFSVNNRIASIIIAQRLDESFDFDALLGAFRHLAIDGFEFVAAIIGKGPAERHIHRQISKLGLGQTITLVPPMQPLRSIFAGADIFIQCSRRIDCNTNLIEAMGVGMAVASCNKCFPDLLVENQTAVLFDPEDELTIYSCLKNLLGKREYARQIALAGQEHLRKYYSVSKMTEALVETYGRAGRWYKSASATAEAAI